MKKLAAFMLCVFLLSAFSITAFADSGGIEPYDKQAVISTTVPSEHWITFKVTGNVEFLLNGEKGDRFRVPRHSEPTLELLPNEGENITSITVNGEDFADKFVDNKYTFPPITEDKELIVLVETEKLPEPKPSDDTPHTGIVGGISVGALALLGIFGIAGRKRTDK